MAIAEADKIWRNGEFIAWRDATTHLLSHGLQYGTSVFEGMRSYSTAHLGVCLFRNKDHFNRFLYSSKVYRMRIDYSVDQLAAACIDTININNLTDAYIRPFATLGYGEMGPGSTDIETDVSIIPMPVSNESYPSGVKPPISVGISSWRRPAAGTIPTGAKASGNYLSSRLIAIEAVQNGFDDGIGLTHDGLISEGQASNVFVVLNDKIYTPPLSESILSGITRDTMIKLAICSGYDVIEQPVTREILYMASEVFLTGTASEISAVASIDNLTVGDGSRPVTEKLQHLYFGLFTGKTTDEWGWLDPVS